MKEIEPYIRAGRRLGILHMVSGMAILIATVISGFELNYAFFLLALLGIMYTIFGVVSFVSTVKFNYSSLFAFLIWCKSSIVLTIMLTVIMVVQFYYEPYGNLHCRAGMTSICVGVVFTVDVISIIASSIGIYYFPRSDEDDESLVPIMELEDLVIPPPVPLEEDPIRRAAIKFNNVSADAAIQYLIQEKVLKGIPVEIANFLYIEPSLNKSKIGDYLGEYKPLNIEVLKLFTNMFDFTNMEFDVALRHFLAKFRLPGEAQKIDRIVESFARRYHNCNPNVFSTSDQAYVLSFSIIMLNTDLHHPHIKKKMSLEDFVKNNRGISKEKDLPRPFLEKLYYNIQKEEIKLGDSLFSAAAKKDWLKKHGKNNHWKKRYVVLSNNTIFYYKKQDDTEPKGLIPLDSCLVRSTKVLDEFYCFELYDPSSRVVKSLKMGKKGSNLGQHQTFIFACKDEKQQESWIQLISGNLISNPVQQLINQKKQRMERQKQKDLTELISENQTQSNEQNDSFDILGSQDQKREEV